MDRVSSIARRALQRLGSPGPQPASGGALPREVRIDSVGMPQLVRLVYLQAGDPLVDQVLAMLKAGRPVYMDRPALEASLGLGQYPPRLQEQFNRWFSRLAGYGIALIAGVPAPPLPAATLAPLPAPSPAPPPMSRLLSSPVSISVIGRPEQAIFAEILGEAAPEPHPCVKEPGRPCCGSGRCKTLGF